MAARVGEKVSFYAAAVDAAESFSLIMEVIHVKAEITRKRLKGLLPRLQTGTA